MRRACNINRQPDFRFITEWVVTAGLTIALPTVDGYTYNATVDWGDGSTGIVTGHFVGNTHTYSNAGTYQIKVKGVFQGWSFNNAGSRLAIRKVINWGNVDLRYIQNGFYGCTNLNYLPLTGSIPYNVNSTNITSLFRGCTSITSIPEKIFSKLTNVTNFGSVFLGCTGITSIPQQLLWNCTSATNFASLFSTTNITSTPTDLFRYNVNVTAMTGVFTLTKLITLTSNLFQYNTAVTSFANCFQSVTLSTIQAGAFDNNVNVTNMTSLFNGCPITSIPSDLFKYNTKVTAFSSTFSSCVTLRAIPNNLFLYNTLVTLYDNTFKSCVNLALPSVIFDLTKLGIVTSFLSFMNATVVGNSNTGTIQDIWNYATNGTLSKTDCFNNQTALSNYASIPVAWT